jgi:hypothetical protein
LFRICGVASFLFFFLMGLWDLFTGCKHTLSFFFFFFFLSLLDEERVGGRDGGGYKSVRTYDIG